MHRIERVSRGRSYFAVLALMALAATACSLGPLQLLSRGNATPQPEIALRRCDEAVDVLCILSFGIEPPDQMIVVLLTSPGLPEDLEVVVTRSDKPATYNCEPTAGNASVLACTGPALPLGSRVLIAVRSPAAKVLLASGEFVLTAFAMPTVSEGVEIPTLRP